MPLSSKSWLVACALVLACASDPARPPTGPVVNDIAIEGTQVLSEGEIKKKILTTETGWWPFAKKYRLDEADWQADLRRIERLYETRGHYNARIAAAEVVPSGDEDEVDLKVKVEEGAPVKVSEFALAGLADAQGLTPPQQAELSLDLPVAVGEVFREGEWVATKSLLRQRLREKGFARSVVEGHALVDVATQAARLRLSAVPGARYQFGTVEVKAPEGGRVEPWRIEEQVRLAIGRDQLFSDSAIEEAQRRVFAMNVFSTARVSTGRPDPQTQTLSVVAEVREGPARTLRLGGGAGIDQVRQEVRAVGEWTDRNWLGGLRRLQTRLLGGWAFIPNTLSVLRSSKLEGPRHGAIYRASADFEQPRLFGRPSLKGKTLLESERTLEQAYTAIGGHAMVGMTWQPRTTWTLFPSYNFQVNRLSGPSSANAAAAPLTLGCSQDPCLVLLSFLEQTATRDTRDSALEPRRGNYLSLSLQEGGGPLGGDFSYVRILPEVRGYHTLGEDDRFTFAARLRAGSLLTRSGRPEESAVTTRFYSGGSMSMRGFAMRRMAPMLLVPIEGEATEKLALPVGGNGIIEGSFEVRARLRQSWLLASFADFGSVTRERLPTGELHRLLWALGLGVRYLTPVGPLRIDLAFRLPIGRPPPLYAPNGAEITYAKGGPNEYVYGRETGANVNKSCFGIGGNSARTWVKDGMCAFHISIGEAF